MKLNINPKGDRTQKAIVSLCDNDITMKAFGVDYSNTKLEISTQYFESNNAVIFAKPEINSQHHKTKEVFRKAGAQTWGKIIELKLTKLSLFTSKDVSSSLQLSFIEGLLLASYKFDKYLTKKSEEVELEVSEELFKDSDFQELLNVVKANTYAKNLVNEPVNFLNTQQFSQEMKNLGVEAGFEVEVLEKKQIEALNMGGLLAVNKGSVDPPAFNILTYKPKGAKNSNPFVLVGKGVVYDTGGYNIKTGDHMNDMKLDMGGAAAVIGAIYAISKNKLPVHVIGLIPSTDNRINGEALVPDDIITMHNGKTVEVKNTDAEGRLILADALSYAQKYKPELVFDMATLTGSAVMLTGDMASCIMGNATSEVKSQLSESGFETHERVAEVPFWEDYQEMLKSDVADLSNLGGRIGGMITAGKFLENFVDYPWVHIDLAGPAFVDSNKDYRQKGGTAYGVRLIYDFVKSYWNS